MKTSRRGPRLGLVASFLLLSAAAFGQPITEYPIPTAASGPVGITPGPDGNLWFTEQSVSQIGTITTAGVITEFPIPTLGCAPVGIAAGSDGALWFVEQAGNKIGRVTTAGAFTEFLIPTANSQSVGITSGPDGALWFAENTTNKIGRIDTGGTITEFPISTSSAHPAGIVAGPDGALWFTEIGDTGYSGIGRITTAGVISEFPLHSGNMRPFWITAGPDGALWFAENGGLVIGRITTAGAMTEFAIPQPSTTPVGMALGSDGALWFTDGFKHVGRLTTAGAFTVLTTPTNTSAPQVIVPGPDGALWFTEYGANKIGRVQTNVLTVTSILPTSGPASGAIGTTVAGTAFDAAATAAVGGFAATNVVVNGASQITLDVPSLTPGFLYDVAVTNPDSSLGFLPKAWFADFLDVPGASPFHSFVEKLVRHQITAGCGGGDYCPGTPVTRAQMAVFLLRSNDGPTYTPPACVVPTFTDVPCSSGFAIWVDELAARGVTAGCGGGNYCPNDPVNRAQMAVFLLVTHDGSGYVPPPCVTPTFGDVPCSSGFARWVDELALRGITIGCGGGNYCPNNPVTRGQMAVFLVTTFGLP